MTFRLLIGTQNPGKLAEYQQLFDGVPLELVSLTDVGLADMDVAETGDTFEANAELKATAYAQASGLFALADDSGLCVDALNGRPGLYSARYGGPGAKPPQQRAKLLAELKGVPHEKRTAYFYCSIVVYNPKRQTPYTAGGRCDGHITTEARGDGGFGYDPIFIPQGHNVTMAELTEAQKHDLSHRGRAARAMRPVLERLTKGLS